MSAKSRTGFIALSVFILALTGSGVLWGATDEEISIQRLTWAGVKIVSGDTTLLVDAVGKDLWDGNAPGGLVPVTVETGRVYALVTHAHNDHFDVETLKLLLGEKGYVIAHESQATYIASRGLRVIPANNWVPVSRGGFVITALPAMDGFGDHQVSWLITRGSTRMLHGGDTLWHGGWKMIGDQFGGVDIAFLPINGAIIGSDPAIGTPAVMTPSQAVDAALLIRAQTLVPIHYGLNDPPYYVEFPNPLAETEKISGERGISLKPMQPGDRLTIE